MDSTTGITGEPIFAVAFSPDGLTLATGGKDRRVRLWEAQTGKLQKVLDTLALRVTSVVFSLDGKMVMAGNDDGNITAWDSKTGQLLRTLRGHELGVTSLSLLSGSSLIASSSMDNTIRLYNPLNEHPKATLYSLRPGESGRYTPGLPSGNDYFPPGNWRAEFIIMTSEGFYSASTTAEEVGRFRIGNDLFPASSFHNQYFRPNLVRQALSGQTLTPGQPVKGPLPPLINFTSHKNGDVIRGNIINITLEATDDSHVQRVRLFIDGVPIDNRQVSVTSFGSRPSSLVTLGAWLVPETHQKYYSIKAIASLPSKKETFKLIAVAEDDSSLLSPRAELNISRR